MPLACWLTPGWCDTCLPALPEPLMHLCPYSVVADNTVHPAAVHSVQYSQSVYGPNGQANYQPGTIGALQDYQSLSSYLNPDGTPIQNGRMLPSDSMLQQAYHAQESALMPRSPRRPYPDMLPPTAISPIRQPYAVAYEQVHVMFDPQQDSQQQQQQQVLLSTAPASVSLSPHVLPSAAAAARGSAQADASAVQQLPAAHAVQPGYGALAAQAGGAWPSSAGAPQLRDKLPLPAWICSPPNMAIQYILYLRGLRHASAGLGGLPCFLLVSCLTDRLPSQLHAVPVASNTAPAILCSRAHTSALGLWQEGGRSRQPMCCSTQSPTLSWPMASATMQTALLMGRSYQPRLPLSTLDCLACLDSPCPAWQVLQLCLSMCTAEGRHWHAQASHAPA